MSTSPAATPFPRRVLLPLAGGNFVVGVGTLVIASMLPALSSDLRASIATVGQLLAGYAIALAIGAPTIAALTSRVDRRWLLTAALALFGVLHLLAAVMPGYASLFAVRVATGFVAAVVTPQAASTAALLVPGALRGRALGFIFLGFSLATVIGVPFGGYLASAIGWRTTLGVVGMMALAVALWMWLQIPAGLHIVPMDRAAWLRLARHPALLLVVAVTVVQGSGQFVLYSYLVPLMHAQAGLEVARAGVIFGVLGVFGLLGNLMGARLMDRLGPAQVVQIALWLMLLAFALWPLIRLSGGHWLVLGLVCAIWGLPVFACNAAQQARLVTLAPDLASASIALNSSGIFLGQAMGAAIGGWVIAGQGYTPLNWWAFGLMLMAIGVSVMAGRAARQSQPA
jgi:predicted MFS family arabinose efflux permease